MVKPIFSSLAVKVGTIVILIEIIVLSIIGGFYIDRFSREVDRRVEDRVRLPGSLMAKGSLNYSLVANRQWMERLVGQELVEGMVLSISHRVFYALNPEMVGKDISAIPGLTPDWFTKDITKPFVKHIVDDHKNYLISVTPILYSDSRTPFFYVYLKINTTHAEIEKAAITRLFLLGSAAAILVTSIAIFLIFRFSILARIQSLLKLFKRVEDGDLAIKIPDRAAPDEIGTLQKGLNSMIAKLHSTFTALQESQKRYRAVVEDIPALICRFLPDGALTFANSEFRKIFYKNYDPSSEHNFFQVMTKEIRENVRNHFVSLTQENPLITYTQQVVAPDGDHHWLQWIGRALFNEEGELTEYQALGKDVTEDIRTQKEKMELEVQLQQSRKMESIGTLAGGIAHDFNNILGIILGNTELAIDDVPKWNQVHFNLEEIKKASLRAKDVVKQLLSFSRQTDQERKPIKLIPIVKDSLKFLRSTIPMSIDIQQNIEDVPDTIFANPTQLHQIMINLCTNASHAMEDGGILGVSIQHTTLNDNKVSVDPDLSPGNYVELTISDTGKGIPSELKDRIFDPYFTTKEIGKGTGLGLSVAHGIVKSHGGAISVESEIGKGTAFHVYFPVVEAKAVMELETDEEIPTGNERILFVDDEESVVFVGKNRLERLGYQVEAQMNPVEALKLFRTNPDQFDLVITDMTMPQMTGDQLVKEILKIRPDMPTILCTGFNEKIDEVRAKGIGIRQYAEKPLNRSELAKYVRKVLDEK